MLVCICPLFLFCSAVFSGTGYIWISFPNSIGLLGTQKPKPPLKSWHRPSFNSPVIQSIRITDICIYASCIGDLVIDLSFAKQFSTLEQNTDFLKAAPIPFSSTAPVSERKCYFYRHSSLPWKGKQYRLLLWYKEFLLFIHFSFISWLQKSIR